MEITDKELIIIKEIANNHRPNQRGIAKNTGLSLGLVNLIIRRLIKKGYIKTKHLDQKKIQYLLTPKGFSEKANKSYKFALKTIELLKAIKKNIQELIIAHHQKGSREFFILGDSELAEITEMVFKNLSGLGFLGLKYSRKKNGKDGDKNKVWLVVRSRDSSDSSIDLITYLSEAGVFYQ